MRIYDFFGLVGSVLLAGVFIPMECVTVKKSFLLPRSSSKIKATKTKISQTPAPPWPKSIYNFSI